ncbi:DNA primase [Patescibacteria group bacterium]|nr:DNA primase [Patescibacteria group bacterium]
MPSQTEEIKQRLDIVDLIKEYVQLTPAGSNLKAKCPFHNEKTPSFMVSPEKQIFHCFGCQAGGDHFEFIKRIDGIEFPEALRILADKAGVKLDYHNPEIHSRKTKTFDLCDDIALYWHQKLKNDAGLSSIRSYLEERGVKSRTIDDFLIGYALESWDESIKYLQHKGYSLLEISQAGISCVSEKGKPYDRFRGRLIFPIRNIHGNAAGFGARKMKDEDTGGKYINSPQTDIYNKSEILYNLDQAKMEIKRLDYAILVEGYMDVLACYQAGTKNAVAVSGTSLTEGQIKILKRYTQNVMIAFDADVAGTLANLRGIDLAWQAGLNVKVIHLPDGKDPDDIIRESAEEWRQLVAKADNYMDYIFKVTLENLDLSRIDHKKKAAQKLLKVIGKLGDEVETAHYVKKLARELDVAEESLRKVLLRLKAQLRNQKSPAGEESTSSGFVKISNGDYQRALAERLLSLLIKFPQQISFISQQLDPEIIAENKAQEVYKMLIIHYNKEQSFNYQSFIKEFSQEHESYLNKLLLLSEVDETKDTHLVLHEEFKVIIGRLKKDHFNNKIKEVGQKIARAEKEKNQDLLKELSEEFNKLMSQLKEV